MDTESIKADIHTTISGSCVGLEVPNVEKGRPTDIVAVIDRSGSMAKSATVKDSTEDTNINILQVVQHAAKAIVQGAANANNTASIITYDDIVNTLCTRVPLTAEGIAEVDSHIDSIRAGGCTNLWGGLVAGLEANGTHNPERQQVVILLTDGHPNVGVPSLGYEKALKKQREREYTSDIYTFGFGYNIGSKLLQQLADGKFHYIPDSSMVGTIFVNAISNILTISHGAQEINVSLSNALFADGTASKDLPVIPLQYGETKYVEIPQIRTMGTKYSSDESYEIIVSGDGIDATQRVLTQTPVDIDVEAQFIRFRYVDFLRTLLTCQDYVKGNEQRLIFTDIVKQSPAKDHLHVTNIMEDLTGQITEGCSCHDWWTKWFLEHTNSLYSAHKLQRCHNFKDPSVQEFGKGILFNKIRDAADEAFDKIPPPVGVVIGVPAQNPGYQNPTAPLHGAGSAATPMSQCFNNPVGTCFSGDSIATLEDGTPIEVDKLTVGQKVRTNDYSSDVATILAIIIGTGDYKVIDVGGPKLTPWHPFKDGNNEWAFPANSKSGSVQSLTTVYNMVLDSIHTINLNERVVVTPGHDFKGPVIGHKYFGSQKVVNDLRGFEEWNDKKPITLTKESFVRDKNGEVIGIRNY